MRFLIILLVCLNAGRIACHAGEVAPIDRHALVIWHNIDWLSLDGQIPLGNGGLLYAVVMMAAGWDGALNSLALGFPNDGSWVVRWERLKKAP